MAAMNHKLQHVMRRLRVPVMLVALVGLLSSCASYYTRNAKFYNAFEQGKLADAVKQLDKGKAETGRNRMLYWLNKGTTLSLMEQYEESNKAFEQAYLYSEDYLNNPSREALALVSNPEMVEYKPEDHEVLLIHYYKAFNFLKMGQNDKALVECKRMQNKLNRLSDKYKSKNKYKEDAFVHTLMGMIYDANGEYNNAFIAYRNALNVYEGEFKQLFNVGPPQQLKEDILRTAALTGFDDQVAFFEKKFNLKYQPRPKGSADVVFFWNNGLGPVKAEWNVNFSIIRGQGGYVTFTNEELGVNFPFPISSESESKGLGQLELVRVAFPKYVERPLVHSAASVQFNGRNIPLEQAYDVNAIAFKVLQERFLADMGKSLMRLALKKSAEYALRKENDAAGALLSIANAVTEKADTRNWGTLPHSIHYTRVTVPAGSQTLTLKTDAGRLGREEQNIYNINAEAGNTYFYTFSSLGYDRSRMPMSDLR